MFLDIAFGIFLALWASAHYGTALGATLVLVCIGFALLPDLDGPIAFALRGVIDGRHRDLSHFPLLYLAVGILGVWPVFDGMWATLFLTGTMFHFVHDSVGIGYGVKWLWPFSDRAHKWFAREDAWWTLRRFHVSWNPAELREVAKKYEGQNWIRYCLPVTWLGAAEFLPFLFALVCLWFV